MQTYQVTAGPQPTPRNYVFVDEHNRHKRLKVMRACEGCRRRKIKCDAATTNTWPCGACRRLKLPCVPPTGGADGDGTNDQAEGIPTTDLSQSAHGNFADQFDGFPPRYQHQRSQSLSIPSGTYDPTAAPPLYSPHEYGYQPIETPTSAGPRPALHEFRYHSMDQALPQPSAPSPKTPEQPTTDALAGHLGDLRISENGMAPYIRQQKAANSEPLAPVEEKEIDLPALHTPGGQICIPPAMMPSEEQAIELFDIFFEHVHPYVPVLCRSQFFSQWNNSRDALSPLLLEAIFACAARLQGDTTSHSAWLALANKHEAAFLDQPRLSTVQALILLLKARESSPKRGYFYKSWITCKTAVSMAKDLELHEHLATHEADESCGSNLAECLTKTRVWQTIAVCEVLIGAPQGRTDMGCDMDTVDYRTDPPGSNIDDYEAKISKQYAFFTRNSNNIRLCLVAYAKVKKKKEWQLDPIFDRNARDFVNWKKELPEELQLPLVAESAPLKIPSHFVGNMHAHHQLGIIMLNRPRISAIASQHIPQSREHWATCYNAAKRLCRIQEAVLDQHGLRGLLCMIRGMSYTIYTTVTCVMLHLVAVTSPDPEFNVDAREYFVRHMRLLEKCAPHWPQPETMQQIENLRTAFSADLDKPFDLRASFPHGSPGDSGSHPHRLSDGQANYNGQDQQGGFVHSHWGAQMEQSHFPTPPMSINSDPAIQQNPNFFTDYGMQAQAQAQAQAQFRAMAAGGFATGDVPMQWNPGPIIDQFSSAFALPLGPPSANPGYNNSPPMTVSVPPSIASQQFNQSPPVPPFDQNVYSQHSGHPSQSPPMPVSTQASHQGIPAGHVHPNATQMFGPSLPQNGQPHVSPIPSQQSFMSDSPQQPLSTAPAIQPQPHNPGMVYVSPKEWQQSVAKVYDSSGLKRGWTFGIVSE